MPNRVQLSNCITVGFFKITITRVENITKYNIVPGLYSFLKAMINQVSFFKRNWTKNMAVTVALGKHKTLKESLVRVALTP